MPVFTNQVLLACSPEEVFEFLRVPGHRLELAPPEMPWELIAGPELLELGSRSTWKTRRFGVSQTMILEVTACSPPNRMVEEQRQGPFRRWQHELRLSSYEEGALLEDVIDFEPPGGMLGVLLTQTKIEEMLAHSFAWRDRGLLARLRRNRDSV